MVRILLVALATLLALPPQAQAARKEPTVQEQYDAGQKYLRRGYYTKALEQFNRIRNYHRDDPLAIKAELAIADVYFKKSEWDQARIAYEDFQRMHPRHADLDYVTMRVGMTLYKKAPKVAARDQTTTRQAVTAWSGFSARFPESAHRDEVENRLEECRERLARKELIIARFYERRAAWQSVEGRAKGLLDDYPKSGHASEALSLAALSAAWQGRPTDAAKMVDRLREKDPAMAQRIAKDVSKVRPPET